MSVGRSVRPSVGPSVGPSHFAFFAFLGILGVGKFVFEHAPAQIMTAPAQIMTAPAQTITASAQIITAPAQPFATGAVVYTALFVFFFLFKGRVNLFLTSSSSSRRASKRVVEYSFVSFPVKTRDVLWWQAVVMG